MLHGNAKGVSMRIADECMVCETYWHLFDVLDIRVVCPRQLHECRPAGRLKQDLSVLSESCADAMVPIPRLPDTAWLNPSRKMFAAVESVCSRTAYLTSYMMQTLLMANRAVCMPNVLLVTLLAIE
jgi:hypothetical protein